MELTGTASPTGTSTTQYQPFGSTMRFTTDWYPDWYQHPVNRHARLVLRYRPPLRGAIQVPVPVRLTTPKRRRPCEVAAALPTREKKGGHPMFRDLLCGAAGGLVVAAVVAVVVWLVGRESGERRPGYVPFGGRR